MKEDKKTNGMNCVLLDCNKRAVSTCNNCRIPICEIHGKRVASQAYLCVNCMDFMKKERLKR